ncbi:hypothetical protein AJ78_03448 [Emergomyces pasteurianus Ep9510]|uniref:NmrA-like domain-containing protein n=1 Tax=Emergomyces pasteurianus Ep9510 TaxID=1447872 RepID=A0A1J9PIR7_9EURO|nr:hypothetical protein AJ78_03448 [Emergomyces pasteurianus Ep9510]
MAIQIRTVMLIGAGGNLGPPVLGEFLKSSFDITVLARESSTSAYPTNTKVVKSNFSAYSLTGIFKGQDAVISIVGPSAFTEQKKIVDAAIAAGVKIFIPSEYGSDTKNPKVLEIAPVLAGKRKLVEYLEQQQDKITWTALIPGLFADWGITHGFLQYDIPSKSAIVWDDGDVPVSQSTQQQVGRALVAILKHPSETANQYVYTSSYTVTANEILTALEKVTGSKWKVEKINLERALCAAKERVAKGEVDLEVIRDLIRAACFTKEAYCDFRKLSWNDRLGLKEESLEDVIKGLNRSNACGKMVE